MKSISKKMYQYFFFYPIYHSLVKRSQEFLTEELDNFNKILISIFLY